MTGIQFEQKYPKAKGGVLINVMLGGKARDVSASIAIYSTCDGNYICCTWQDPGNDERYMPQLDFDEKYPDAITKKPPKK